jgi:hypothetical protein
MVDRFPVKRNRGLLMAHMMIVFPCWTCKKATMACPNCVMGLPIDPETNLPPDVEWDGTGYRKITPDPDAVRRAVKHPVCDACANKAGFPGTAEDRHADKGGWC